MDTNNSNLIELAADIVSAFVRHNSVPVAALPSLIADVNAALLRLAQPATASEPEAPKPPVPIKKTVTPDHIISLEDGKPYKSLKRHLSKHGLTPDEYRAKWGLAKDYPMVAPTYAAQRSALAKQLGLGRKPEAKAPAKASAKAPAKAPARGRKKAAS